MNIWFFASFVQRIAFLNRVSVTRPPSARLEHQRTKLAQRREVLVVVNLLGYRDDFGGWASVKLLVDFGRGISGVARTAPLLVTRNRIPRAARFFPACAMAAYFFAPYFFRPAAAQTARGSPAPPFSETAATQRLNAEPGLPGFFFCQSMNRFTSLSVSRSIPGR